MSERESFHNENFHLSVDRSPNLETFDCTAVILVAVNLHMRCLWCLYYYCNNLLHETMVVHTQFLRTTVRNRCFSEHMGLIHPELVASRGKIYEVGLVGMVHPEALLHKTLMEHRKKDLEVQMAGHTRSSEFEEHHILVLVDRKRSMEVHN